jgi:hypothetical protein
LTDPEVINSDRIWKQEKVLYLDPAEELFMLALRAEKPARPNTDSVAQLYTFYGTMVPAAFILVWFQTRFDHKGRVLLKAKSCASWQVLTGKCYTVH